MTTVSQPFSSPLQLFGIILLIVQEIKKLLQKNYQPLVSKQLYSNNFCFATCESKKGTTEKQCDISVLTGCFCCS